MIEAAKSGSINMVEIDERAVYLWQVKKSSKSKILHIEKNMFSKYNEIEFAYKIKRMFQSVHIFISSDVEEDVMAIREHFYKWRKRQI